MSRTGTDKSIDSLRAEIASLKDEAERQKEIIKNLREEVTITRLQLAAKRWT
jgi:predicted RNase H-like nuclease (RuvC/YqgF family)